MNKYYITPERKQPLNFTLALSFSSIWSLFIGFIYGIIIAFSPLVYLNIFICLGFGLALGYGTRFLSRLAKLIDKNTTVRISLMCALLGLYASWVSYIVYFQETPDLNATMNSNAWLFFNPIEVVSIMSQINKFGLWEIGGMAFNGFLLTIIWILEALIILLVPFLMVRNMPTIPYSEKCKRWYKKHIFQKDFEKIVMQKNFVEDLERNKLETIHSLGNGMATRFARVSVYFLEDEEYQYLSVENILRDGGGKKETSEPIIYLLRITTSEARELMKKYYAKKAFFLEY